MKFFLGLVAGAAGAWYYLSRQPDLSHAPQFMDQARHTMTSAAASGAQRAAEVIDRSPIAPQAKDVANRIASMAPGASSTAEQPSSDSAAAKRSSRKRSATESEPEHNGQTPTATSS